MSARDRLLLWLAAAFAYVRHPQWMRKFRRGQGFWPRVALPRTVNEKLLWRKLFDRNPLYRTFADKLAARAYASALCPDLAASEIVWIGHHPADLPDACLHPDFVIKTNNASSRNIFFTAAGPDRASVTARLGHWLRAPFRPRSGEWNYQGLPALIMVERMVCALDDPKLIELNCFVASGQVRLMLAQTNVKRAGARRGAFGRDGAPIAGFIGKGAGKDLSPLPDDFQLPALFPRAIAHAEILAQGCDYVRVDFLTHGEHLYFCECTVFPTGGNAIYSGEADGRVAPYWDLRDSWFLRAPQPGLRGLYARALQRHLDRQANATP